METFKSMNAEVESLLSKLGPQEPEDNSDPSDMPDQTSSANESAERQDNNIVDSVQSETPKNYNLSTISDTRETAESVSGSPKVVAGEVIEQFEPGVYVTLVQLTNGTKIFKRVKFRYFNKFIFGKMS